MAPAEYVLRYVANRYPCINLRHFVGDVWPAIHQNITVLNDLDEYEYLFKYRIDRSTPLGAAVITEVIKRYG